MCDAVITIALPKRHLHHADDAGPPLGTPYTRSVAWPCLYLVIMEVWQAGWQSRRDGGTYHPLFATWGSWGWFAMAMHNA